MYLLIIIFVFIVIYILKKTIDYMAGEKYYSPEIFISNVINEKNNLKQISLMTLNIAHGRKNKRSQLFQTKKQIKENLKYISNTIEEYLPDLLSLQEADAASFWSGNFSHIKYILKNTSFCYSIQGEHVKGMRLAYGTAILSKICPKNSLSVCFRPVAPLLSKGFVSCDLELDNKKIKIVSLHLDFARSSLRIEQAKIIIKEFKEKCNPMIIMGDFNCDEKMKNSVICLLIKELKLKAYKINSKNMSTFKITNKRLDWILISEELKFLEYKVVKEKMSDHSGIFAVVEF